jgi:hypothetical protein
LECGIFYEKHPDDEIDPIIHHLIWQLTRSISSPINLERAMWINHFQLKRYKVQSGLMNWKSHDGQGNCLAKGVSMRWMVIGAGESNEHKGIP